MTGEGSKRAAAFLAHVVLPTAVGAGVYVGWRSPDLLVFRWIDAAGLGGLVYRPPVPLPGWALYSLPDGCWVYATTSWMLLIWGRLGPWAFAGLAIAVGAEVGQRFGVVAGTFDTDDLIFYVGGFILSGAAHADAGVKVRRSGGRSVAE